MTEPDREWIYAVDGKRIGPVSAREIAVLISSDRLSLGALVWKPGMKGWISASDAPEIARLCAPPLPESFPQVRQGAVEPMPQVAQAVEAPPEAVSQRRTRAAEFVASPSTPRDDEPQDWQGVADILAERPAPKDIAGESVPVGQSAEASVKASTKGTLWKASALTAVALLFGRAIGMVLARSMWPPGPVAGRPTSAAFLSRTAAEINTRFGLPKLLDPDTEMLTTEGVEGAIVYHYRLVKYTVDQLDRAAFEASRKAALKEQACTTPGTHDRLLKQGIAMRYVYRDRLDVPIASIEIRLADCKPDF